LSATENDATGLDGSVYRRCCYESSTTDLQNIKREKNQKENNANNKDAQNGIRIYTQEVNLNNLQTTCSLLSVSTSVSNDTSISGIKRERPVGSMIADQKKGFLYKRNSKSFCKGA
jgi:hypothetical protein